MKKIIFFIMLIAAQGQASDYTLVRTDALESTRAWDHFGTSFAINTIMYGLAKKAFKMERRHAVLFSVMSTFMITTVYSLAGNNQAERVKQDLLYNAIGIGLSAGATFVFEF